MLVNCECLYVLDSKLLSSLSKVIVSRKMLSEMRECKEANYDESFGLILLVDSFYYKASMTIVPSMLAWFSCVNIVIYIIIIVITVIAMVMHISFALL